MSIAAIVRQLIDTTLARVRGMTRVEAQLYELRELQDGLLWLGRELADISRSLKPVMILAVIAVALATLHQDTPLRAQPYQYGLNCNSAPIYNASTSGSTQLQAAPPSGGMFICGYTIGSAGAVNVSLVYGTGTNCATGTTTILPALHFQTNTSGIAAVTDGYGVARGMFVPAGNELCINTSAAVSTQAVVYVFRQT